MWKYPEKLFLYSPQDKKKFLFLLVRFLLPFIIISSFIYLWIEHKLNYTYIYAAHFTGLLFQICSTYTKLSLFHDIEQTPKKFPTQNKTQYFINTFLLGNCIIYKYRKVYITNLHSFIYLHKI
jgi:hypothetical protein